MSFEELGAVAGTLGGAGMVLYALARWGLPSLARTWRHAIKGRAQVAMTNAEAHALDRAHDEREAERVWERLEDVERKLEHCEGRHDECRDQLADTRAVLHVTRTDLGRLSERVEELLEERDRRSGRDADSTGVHEVREISRRSKSDPALALDAPRPPPRRPPPPPLRRSRDDMEPES